MIALPDVLSTIWCASGPYGMAATLTMHLYDRTRGRTLCGKPVDQGGRWSNRDREHDRRRLRISDVTCSRCAGNRQWASVLRAPEPTAVLGEGETPA